MIDPAGYADWLDPGVRVDVGFDVTVPPEQLIAYPVSAAVNSVRNNTPDLLDQIPLEDAAGPPRVARP